MNKGRIIVKTILTRLSLSAAVLLLCAPVAYAQQGNPEVYIDMSTLQGGGHAPAAAAPIKLRPPAPRPAHEQGLLPRLTAPVAPPPVLPPEETPVVAPPAPKPAVVPQAVTAPPSAPAQKTIKPETVSKSPDMPPDTLPLRSALPPSTAIPAPVPPAATVFPVETRVRQETNDPAHSDSSRPVPVRPGIAGNLQDTVVPSRPLPDMDPAAHPPTSPAAPVRALTAQDKVIPPPLVPSRKPQATASKITATPSKVRIDAVRDDRAAQTAADMPEAAAKTQVPPLVPARRPSFVEKAPADLVAELRAREAAREAAREGAASVTTSAPDTVQKRKIDLTDPPPPPGPRGQKNMPAVKKAVVEAETIAEQVIKLPAQNDPLLDSLIEKDKESLVATIESIVAAREDGKPLPAAAKPQREAGGSNIVKAEPMQRPYNVYRPNKTVDEETKTARLPAVPLAAGPRPPLPQAQDEQAYISVPFAEGLTDIDAKIIAEIEARILPILNQNPAWKLQIQAFASPVKDGASSARKASLTRALAVRTYLLGKGIDATRMDVRALGAESDRDPMDRVDLIVFDPAKRS